MRRLVHFAQEGDTSGFFPQLARWHDRARFRMCFATLRPMAPWLREFMEGQGVHTFSCECRRRTGLPRACLRLARYLRGQRVDVLHTHLFEPSIVGLTAGVLAGTPLRVSTRHYSDYHTRIDKKWHVRLDRYCTWMSHEVIAVSQHTAEHMIAREAAPPQKVHAIVNGIDFGRVKISSAAAPARIRREFAADGAYLLLMVGRMHPEKGYDYLFKAMTKLARGLDRPVRALIAGTGPLEERYREQVRSLGCAEAVQFLGFRKDVPDLMAAADIVVLPSLAEAFGLVVTEALYLGKPVVATRVGGIPEIVSDGVDGVLIPPADSVALVDAIAGLLQDPERRRRMSGAGRQKVQERFGFEDMVRSYEAIYDRPQPQQEVRFRAPSLDNHSHV